MFGSEFQTAGAEHRKEPFAGVVVVKYRDYTKVDVRRLYDPSPNFFGHLFQFLGVKQAHISDFSVAANVRGLTSALA